MEIRFYKYQGTGNDFIIIDDRSNNFDISQQTLVQKMCHRHFGIGADGMILLRNHSQYDFEMVYFNSDGRLGSMCGNGGRCIVQFAKDLGIIPADKVVFFVASDGLHEAYMKENLIYLKMQDVYEIESSSTYYFLNTGSPHHIEFVTGLDELNVYERGRRIRYDDYYHKIGGTNVNFAELGRNNTVSVRTYERGVENETYSCGTGVTAVALTTYFKGFESPVKVYTKGGILSVSFEKTEKGFENIYLIGPAEFVFEGIYKFKR
ncbi:MAG: diaminopimelate epimerase [Cytophagales bacterium]|nr:diaminopimelate epimerase [Cytophagales bacterium]MDW8383240.1 diaminopimelate epimerase [Flammeovirgaceae bacterium]